MADSLTVRFSVGKRLFTEEPVGAVLKKDGAVLFDGIVDGLRRSLLFRQVFQAYDGPNAQGV